jgi:hypothetical protein
MGIFGYEHSMGNVRASKKMKNLQIILFILFRVADPHQFNADPGPDPAFYLNADSDPI